MKPVPERRLLVVASLMLLSAAGARAHDFWLVPNAFYPADGDALEVRGQTSSKFPTSEAAVAVQRVADARVLTASSDERITRLAVAGASLMLSHNPRGSGQRIVAVALHPTIVRASGPGFKEYMELEGAADLAARYDR